MPMGRIRIVKTHFEADVFAKVPKKTESFDPGEQVLFVERRGGQTVFARGSDVAKEVERAKTNDRIARNPFIVATTIFDASTEVLPPP